MQDVKAVKSVIKWLAGIAGAVAGWYGGLPQAMRVLVVFMGADYLLGLVCALTGHSAKTETGHFLSQVAFVGLLKKGVILLVVYLAIQLDKALGQSGAAPGEMFQMAATFFYIASEGLSIIENAGLLGVPIPRVLRQALEALRDKNDGGEKDEKQDRGDDVDNEDNLE